MYGRGGGRPASPMGDEGLLPLTTSFSGIDMGVAVGGKEGVLGEVNAPPPADDSSSSIGRGGGRSTIASSSYIDTVVRKVRTG